MPRRGGEAAQHGFRYQDLWTVDAALDLIEGDAIGLEVEPSRVEDTGIDFNLTTASNVQESHSIKRRHRRGNWTINRLSGEGSTDRDILADLIASTHAGGRGVFGSGTSASDLEWLIEHARASNSWSDFERRIGSDGRISGGFYQHFLPRCGSKEAAHVALTRLRVRVKNEPELLRDIELRIRATFRHRTWDPVDARAVRLLITDFVARNLGRHLTAASICTALETHGYVLSQLAGNTSVARRIRDLTQAHVAYVQRRRINNADIPRHEAETAARGLLERDQHVVLEGTAGSGKSCAATQILTQLANQDIPCLAIRLDWLQEEDLSAQAIGRRRGLPESPVVTLGEYASGRTCVLCIDQLDALSVVSARQQSVWGPFNELMNEVERYPNMRLVLACRTFDLEQDSRLRELVAQLEYVERISIGPLDSVTVQEAVAASSTAAAPLSHDQFQVLSTALHLFLFLEVSRTGPVDFTSAGDLFDRYWIRKAQAVDGQVNQTSAWTRAIDALCHALSARESLATPLHTMDEHAVVLGAMASEGVVQIRDQLVSFFDESFFDYAFARTFLRSNSDLVAWLAADTQHLFRRSQVRQILTFLRSREPDRRRYLRTLESLLSDDQVRFHIMKLVLSWMRELPDPTDAEWRILERLSIELGDHVWSAVRDRVPWFDLLQDLGRWAAWLSGDDDQTDCAVWLIGMPAVLDSRSGDVAGLIAPFRGRSDKWRDRLRWLAFRGRGYNSPGMQSLVLCLVADGTLDDAPPGSAESNDWWMELHTVTAEEPAFIAKVLGTWFDRQMARAAESEQDDPFQGDAELVGHSQFSSDMITECAKLAPSEFVQELLPRFVDLEELAPRNWVSAPSRFGSPDEHLRHALASAMAALASSDPRALDSIMVRVDPSESTWMSALVLQAWSANPRTYSECIVRFLLERPDKRLSIGYSIWSPGTDAYVAISRIAVAVASRHCSDAALSELVDAILHFTPDSERNTQHVGRTELALLRAISESRLPEGAQRRTRVLERRFPHAPERGVPEPPADPFVVSVVGPPIPDDAQHHLTDAEWLAAMKRYANDSVTETNDAIVGGALELSRGLQNVVRDDPERFTRLADRMAASLHPAYFEAILQGLARTDNDGRRPGTLAQVCAVLRRITRASVQVGPAEIARAIGDLAHEQIPDEIMTMLCEIAQHEADPRADEWQDRVPAVGPIDQALNSARGAAAFAISKLLFADRSRWAILRPTVEQLARDPVLAVRTATAPCLLAVLDSDREDAMGFFRMLVDDADAILGDRHVGQFVHFAMFRDYIAIRPVLRRMLRARHAPVAVAGSRHIAIAALSIDAASEDLHHLMRRGVQARTGVAEVCAAHVADAALGEDCERRLRTFFTDESPAVREAAGTCWRNLDPDQVALRGHLIGAFAQTLQPDDEVSVLVHKLRQASRTLPAEVCDLAERAIETFGPRAASWQFREGGVANNLSHLMVRLYEETSNDELRARVLEAIDTMVRAGFIGIDERLREQFDR